MSKGSNRRPGNSDAFDAGYARIFGDKKPEKGRFVWDDETKKFIPAGKSSHVPNAPMVFGDVRPYKSMVTGELIDGRRQHREHLKTHNVVEVGNDIPMKHQDRTPRTDLKEQIARVVYSKLRY